MRDDDGGKILQRLRSEDEEYEAAVRNKKPMKRWVVDGAAKREVYNNQDGS